MSAEEGGGARAHTHTRAWAWWRERAGPIANRVLVCCRGEKSIKKKPQRPRTHKTTHRDGAIVCVCVEANGPTFWRRKGGRGKLGAFAVCLRDLKIRARQAGLGQRGCGTWGGKTWYGAARESGEWGEAMRAAASCAAAPLHKHTRTRTCARSAQRDASAAAPAPLWQTRCVWISKKRARNHHQHHLVTRRKRMRALSLISLAVAKRERANKQESRGTEWRGARGRARSILRKKGIGKKGAGRRRRRCWGRRARLRVGEAQRGAMRPPFFPVSGVCCCLFFGRACVCVCVRRNASHTQTQTHTTLYV